MTTIGLNAFLFTIAFALSFAVGGQIGENRDMQLQTEAIQRENVELYGTPDGSVKNSTNTDSKGDRFYAVEVVGVCEKCADGETYVTHDDGSVARKYVRVVRLYVDKGVVVQTIEDASKEYSYTGTDGATNMYYCAEMSIDEFRDTLETLLEADRQNGKPDVPDINDAMTRLGLYTGIEGN